MARLERKAAWSVPTRDRDATLALIWEYLAQYQEAIAFCFDDIWDKAATWDEAGRPARAVKP